MTQITRDQLVDKIVEPRHIEGDVIERGLYAERPSGSTDVKAFYATDTNSLYLWDGSEWQGDTDWTDLTLLNSWANYNAGIFGVAGYRKVGNIVYLRGLVASGTAATIATLPAGYRPAQQMVLPGITWDDAFCRIDIDQDGDIRATDYSTTWVNISNIQYPID